MNPAPPYFVPCLQYADAPKAIAWLGEAFGFEPHLVVPGETPDVIVHAQLALGRAMIMASTVKPGATSPADVGPAGLALQGIYVVVDDADAVHARAMKAGATPLNPLVDQDYGGRGFSVRDPEGYPWHFGTYDPWADHGKG